MVIIGNLRRLRNSLSLSELSMAYGLRGLLRCHTSLISSQKWSKWSEQRRITLNHHGPNGQTMSNALLSIENSDSPRLAAFQTQRVWFPLAALIKQPEVSIGLRLLPFSCYHGNRFGKLKQTCAALEFGDMKHIGALKICNIKCITIPSCDFAHISGGLRTRPLASGLRAENLRKLEDSQ